MKVTAQHCVERKGWLLFAVFCWKSFNLVLKPICFCSRSKEAPQCLYSSAFWTIKDNGMVLCWRYFQEFLLCTGAKTQQIEKKLKKAPPGTFSCQSLMKLIVSQVWVEAEKKIDVNSSNQLFLHVTKTAGLINDGVCGVQTQLNGQASVDRTQNLNVLTTCDYLQCEVQWGRMTSEVAMNAYSQLGLLNHTVLSIIMFIWNK